MTGDILEVEERSDVLWVRLNRPEKRNALSRELLARIREAFIVYAECQNLRAAVITGEGAKSFAAGGDLKDLSSIRTEAESRTMSVDGRASLDSIRQFPVPVIAALNGDALGGGAELAVACDFRVASEHARIGFLQSRLCITPAWGGGGDLFDIVGTRKAMLLLCSASALDSPEALSVGLYDRITRNGQALTDLVDDFLAPIIDKPPEVLRALKNTAIQARRWRGRDEFEDNLTSAFVRTWTHPAHWAAAEKALNKSKVRNQR